MRIGILYPNTYGRGGGVVTMCYHMYSILRRDPRYEAVDVLYVQGIPKPPKNPPQGIPLTYLNYRKDELKRINEYDYLIILHPIGAGNKEDPVWLRDFLDNLQVPFMLGINQERELLFRQFPYFATHPKLHCIKTPGAEHTGAIVEAMVKAGAHPVMVYDLIVYDVDGSPPTHWSERPPVIGTNCRIVPCKNVDVLLQHVWPLRELGLDTEIWGYGQFHHMQELQKRAEEGGYPEVFRGEFHYHQIQEVVRRMRFHFNVLWRKKDPVSPHIEYATMEAIHLGALPIVSGENSPEDFLDCCIPLNSDQFDDLPAILASYDDQALDQVQNRAWGYLWRWMQPDRLRDLLHDIAEDGMRSR